jgi:8-oxo-dGTP pyrophosphatase MutT (NUDIX family)
MSHIDFPAFLSRAFDKPLPGWAAQRKMISYARPGVTPDFNIPEDAKLGGVLVMIYPKDGAMHTLLIKRPDYDGVHGGQVSFPGGKKEDSDPDLFYTALRETREEIGIELSEFQPLGPLTRVYIPPGRFLVEPYVVSVALPGAFHPDSHEVESLIELPLETLKSPNAVREIPMFVKMLEREISVRCFVHNGYPIWGATAMMLAELRELLFGEIGD